MQWSSVAEEKIKRLTEMVVRQSDENKELRRTVDKLSCERKSFEDRIASFEMQTVATREKEEGVSFTC